MKLGLPLGLLGLLLLVSAANFSLKTEVMRRERELRSVNEAITAERWRKRTLEAEVAYLGRPDRIMPLARQFDMVPATGARIVTLDEIHLVDHLELAGRTFAFTLDTGEELELRFKPVRALSKLDALDE